jgi:hypothetical protein
MKTPIISASTAMHRAHLGCDEEHHHQLRQVLGGADKL